MGMCYTGWTFRTSHLLTETSDHWVGLYWVLSCVIRLKRLWSTLGRPSAHATWYSKAPQLFGVSGPPQSGFLQRSIPARLDEVCYGGLHLVPFNKRWLSAILGPFHWSQLCAKRWSRYPGQFGHADSCLTRFWAKSDSRESRKSLLWRPSAHMEQLPARIFFLILQNLSTMCAWH